MKTFEMKERTVSLIHLYAGFAMCSDGHTSIRVPLTDEQIVQLASDACELAAKILRWEKAHGHADETGSTPSGGKL